MSNPLINPDSAWVFGSIAAAAISAYPAYLAAKRGSRKAESTEHAEQAHDKTRAMFAEVVGPLSGRLDEIHMTLTDVAAWQAQHATDHAISELTKPRIEIRKGN